MIALADTSSYPGTVMIVNLNTGSAVTAVEGTRGPDDIACSTLQYTDLFSINNWDILLTVMICRCIAMSCRPSLAFERFILRARWATLIVLDLFLHKLSRSFLILKRVFQRLDIIIIFVIDLFGFNFLLGRWFWWAFAVLWLCFLVRRKQIFLLA